MDETTAPKPGEPVTLRAGTTGFISQKLSHGLDAGTWRVLVKDPTTGARRATIRAARGAFLWEET